METASELIEWCLWHSLSLWKIVWWLLRDHWPTVLLLLTGDVGGVWLSLLKVCARRYRRFVNGPSVQGRPSAERRWKTFEAIWATPMVVLEARGEHEDGLGRLLYKWLEAYHALWCVFLPDVLELSCKSTVKYWRGSRAECRRTVDRACYVWRGLWAFLSLSVYAVFYTVVYVYDFVEAVCQGTVGVGVLLLTINYVLSDARLNPDATVMQWSCVVATIGVASYLLKSYEAVSGGRSPVKMAEDSYADWLREVEELQQAERLSEAFWRADWSVGRPKPVRTLSGLRAQQRALRAKMKADKEEETARRGRRVPVGEDVPSGNGGHRVGYGLDRSPVVRQSTCELLLEEQLVEDELTEQSSDFSED
ncbi:hypothetical protein PF008_g22714 [Phytophthora fragariae]|uniref:Transmembrane protein n=2 Tax=Phytophthora fragariae TaxID=53985 RepID=A0A6G0QSY0_9STRA|nr:hypothetical protein PF008_g22714 [Phytophthora fragariae]